MSYNETLDRLNEFAKTLLSGNLLDRFEGLIFKNYHVQVYNNTATAFNLDPVQIGTEKVLLSSNTTKDNAIIRMPLSYDKALELVETEQRFNVFMTLVANNALISFVNAGIDLTNKELVAHRHLSTDTFFMASSSGADYEIRFQIKEKQ